MVDIGTAAGRRMAAVVSDMSQPLGRAVGNALEVAEALDTLEGHGPADFSAFALDLAALVVSVTSEGRLGRADVDRALQSGSALSALRAMIDAQGGDPSPFEDRARLPRARLVKPVLADSDGYLAELDALTVARASIVLGAGRERKGDPIDLAVGVVLEAKLGDQLSRGQPLAMLHANDEARLAEAEQVFRTGIRLAAAPVAPPALILDRLVPAAAGPTPPPDR
jgi:pyrimidine-nucleoside phosphorylase